MVDLDERPSPVKANRSAALWAAAIAIPVAVVVGLVVFAQIKPEAPAEPKAAAPVPTTAVQMESPKLSARAQEVCLAVTSQLPGTVRDLPARQVSAGPEQNAAWGEPPLTVACGVAQPRMCEALGETGCVPLDTELLIMNRVCWYAAPGPAGATFTTMDREVPVQVTVPTAYEQPAQWANEFSDIVVKTDVSKTEGVPSGCA